jgi:predicted nucleic acid-binding protein
MICVDASVAAKWVLEEDASDKALILYRDNQDAGLVAPPFLLAEVTNAIWRRAVRTRLGRQDAEDALTAFLAFEVALAAPVEVYLLALQLADQFARPAVYDMHYVALAQIAGCELWTADQRLLNALGGRLAFVRPLQDYGS